MSQVLNYRVDQSILTTVRKWSLGTAKSGTDFVRVSFDNYISWTGFLTEKTIERTMETLDLLGFKGKDLSQLSDDNALDTESDFAAVIGELREWEGKTYYTAKFINQGSGQGFDVKSKDLVDKFSKYDTTKYIENTKNAPKSEPWAQEQPPQYENHNFNDSEIPF